MPTRTATSPRPHRGPLRSPLAAVAHAAPIADLPGPSARQTPAAAVPEPRSVTLDEFRDYLRTVNNRDGRPYEETTISAYLFPASGSFEVLVVLCS